MLRSTEWLHPAGWPAGERHRLVSQSPRLRMLAVGYRCQHSDAQPAVSGAFCSRCGKIVLSKYSLGFFILQNEYLLVIFVIAKTVVCFYFICSHLLYLYSIWRAVAICRGHHVINCIFSTNWQPELKTAGGHIRVVSVVLHDPDLVFLFYCILLSADRPHSDYFGREGQPWCLQDLPKGKTKALNSLSILINSSIVVDIVR